MFIDGAITEAASGLDSVSKRLSTIAQNVSNANTPDYVRETRPVDSVVAGGEGMGVRTDVAIRTLDVALQGDLFATGAQVADDQVRQTALSAVDAASGTPGSGGDLAGLVGALRDAFSTLLEDPSNATQQSQVVNQAAALARGVNGVGAAISDARQSAQDNLVTDVAAANTALQTVGQLSVQIIAVRSEGQSTADLEDQRDVAMRTATALTGARFLPQANGTLLAVSGGTALRLDASTGPLSIGSATLGPNTPAAAVPKLLVDGVAAPLGSGSGGGGRIGAELAMRDTVLPGLQTGLDGFAQALATGFAGQGLSLFTNASGVLPPAGTAGFAQVIQVSPAVQAAPSMVRDGAGPAGAAGSTTLISALLGTALASGAGTIAGQAGDLVASHAALAASATTQLTTDTAVQASLKAKLDAGTGVSIDSEMTQMVQLQNSYGANAKVIAAAQAMWTQLLTSVQ